MDDEVVGAARLTNDAAFRPAGRIDSEVPPGSGIYAVRLRADSSLPHPFEELRTARRSHLIYVGKATSLRTRMLRNELRGRGHGTFFRSIGAVLGFRPLAGSLADNVNKQNYSFSKPDRDAVVDWINANLEVSWLELTLEVVRPTEKALIIEHKPLFNLDGNPLALAELDQLRAECRAIAAGASTPPL